MTKHARSGTGKDVRSLLVHGGDSQAKCMTIGSSALVVYIPQLLGMPFTLAGLQRWTGAGRSSWRQAEGNGRVNGRLQ